jgi:hypothetical protein
MKKAKRIHSGMYEYKGYRLLNCGYHQPDHCIWWQAVDIKTGCTEYSKHTKRELMNEIDMRERENKVMKSDEYYSKTYPTWIIAYCPDINAFFTTNQRHFFWEFSVEFQCEDEAVNYFKTHINEFYDHRKEILKDVKGGWRNDSELCLMAQENECLIFRKERECDERSVSD